MNSTRQLKVARVIQKDLGEIFQQNNKTMFHGSMITVTAVRMSPDLSFAKVYISIFSIGKEKDEIFALIKDNVKPIRTMLGNRVKKQFRIVPEIAFYIDDSLDYIENIDSLLNQ